jgi:imidazolonepropionase-like amidohydrolase
VAAGGRVLFGTDLGAVEYDPSAEYRAMSETGMSFRQILASLTTAPAQRFGDAEAGRLVPGFPADVVVLNGDPARDIAALASVAYTLRAGRIVHRATPCGAEPVRLHRPK